MGMRKGELLCLTAAISLAAWWQAPTRWNPVYPYRIQDLSVCHQLLDKAGIPNHTTQDSVEISQADVARARAVLAGQRLPKVSKDYRDGPGRSQLGSLKEDLRMSILCVPGVADAQVEIHLPAEKAFAEIQPPPQVRVALRMEGKVDVAAVVHLAQCAFPGLPEAEVTVLYL